MGFYIVLIQEPPMGKRRKITAGNYSLYKPENSEKYNRVPRVWLAIHKQSEKDKYILEERNGLSESPDIQIFDIYQKIRLQNRGETKRNWKKGRRTRIVNIYDQKIKKNPTERRRGMMELKNWQEIIDKPTILAGDFNAHDPTWGLTKTENSTYIIELIEPHHLTIANKEEYTRYGHGNQLPSIIDLTMTAGPMIEKWEIVDRDEHHSSLDHRIIMWEHQIHTPNITTTRRAER
jgi:hypothetical protein